MADLSQWDFASEFLAQQAARLIEGKDPSFTDMSGDTHFYQQAVSHAILGRMRSDYKETLNNYASMQQAFKILQLLPSEKKLPSSLMNVMAKNCFEFGKEAEFVKWLYDANASDFDRQTFTRKDIQHWLDSNKFPTKYQFVNQADDVAAELPVNKGQTVVGPWPWGNHHTELLGHLDAAARRYWGAGYDPSDTSTASTNATVSEWLQTERKVSRTMADSIASILRADGLPYGPRK